MDYAQGRVTTLHDLTGTTPVAATDQAAIVVPMTEREHGSLAAERVLTELERIDPAKVVIPLRADVRKVADFRDWVTSYDLNATLLWCDGPRVTETITDARLDGPRGKGRDVWLAIGAALASNVQFVVVHDADTASYDDQYVPRLLFPLSHGSGFDFVKGYYARVENERLYGRLFRLFYAPLVRTLRQRSDAPLLAFLDAFRYALAGEFAVTRDLLREMRFQRTWGLEVGTLAEVYDRVGFEGAAQVDLGNYEHDHRAVSGPTGLSEMSRSVGTALFHAIEEAGIDPEYPTLPERYRETAQKFIRSYETDAAFNGLTYDAVAEREQVDAYADAIQAPEADTRLPAWEDASLSPADLVDAARADLAELPE